MDYFSNTNDTEFQYRSTDGKFYDSPEACLIASTTYYSQCNRDDSESDKIINNWTNTLSSNECDFSTYKVFFYTFKDLYQNMPISIETLERLAYVLLSCKINQTTEQEEIKVAEYKAIIQIACNNIKNAKDSLEILGTRTETNFVLN